MKSGRPFSSVYFSSGLCPAIIRFYGGLVFILRIGCNAFLLQSPRGGAPREHAWLSRHSIPILMCSLACPYGLPYRRTAPQTANWTPFLL